MKEPAPPHTSVSREELSAFPGKAIPTPVVLGASMIQGWRDLPESILVSSRDSVMNRVRPPRNPNGDKPELSFTGPKEAAWLRPD